jgi:tetratricopeptide (TPR) repeat protein
MFHRDATTWKSIQDHLPDPATAAPSLLEQQADILRARRFPEDALTYYKYALDRGGSTESLINKIGLTHLQLGHTLLAQMYFQQVVKTYRWSAEGWNNLGAVAYMNHDYAGAVKDYKRSLKLQPQSAVFHSNLGLAYMGKRDFNRSREELGMAMKLNPDIFRDQGTAGVSAHFLSAEDRGRFCYEMARTYAESGNVTEMLLWLAKASESGVDVLHEMSKDNSLVKYIHDARVVTLAQIGDSLNGKAPTSGVASTSTPSTPNSPKLP